MARTALYEVHIELGGKIVDFAGFELPIQYSKGIIAEHNAVRHAAGIFDVSHMGEFLLCGKDASSALQRLMSNKIAAIANKQCRYTLMCARDGGIVDDLLIYKYNNEKYLLVVNASNIQKDFDWIQSNLTGNAVLENISDKISLIALQGPRSKEILSTIIDTELLPQKNYYFEEIEMDGKACLISTTGYTGESGYEIYTDNQNIQSLYKLILAKGARFGLEPVGLGARDTLRFESSMPLYGHELTKDTKANEVGLDFFVKLDENFIGRDYLINNPPKYERRGLRLADRGIARENCNIYSQNGDLLGYTTSGGPCPTLGGAYCMARVVPNINDSEVFIDVRGKKLKAEWTAMPFYKKQNK